MITNLYLIFIPLVDTLGRTLGRTSGATLGATLGLKMK